MTQLERYAQMMKIELGAVRAHIAYGFSAQGSVLAQTVRARGDKIEIHYDIECDADPARVAGLIRNARNGCYVRQTINNPELFLDTINLNGQPFNPADYPPPARR
jgi:hypothetical protein